MTQTASSQELIISRVFDAPRELVYRAFTDPDQLAKWFGPVGYSVPRGKTRLELRAGPFLEGTDDVRGGWESSFTKLDALLKAA
jgi:uncharacterized protein YndB with AHSA1/START domain